MIKIYNTLTRKKENFRPLRKEWVGLYTCGPTVYNYAHIGNLRTYIFEDVLRRTLEFFGYSVKHVMNITDVGHLTSDADEGEDKIERNAKNIEEVKAITRKYTEAFLSDLRELNIELPDPENIVPASSFIKEQQEIIHKLFPKGYAYQTTQAVYFDVSKLKDYGKLRGYGTKGQVTAVREEVVSDPEKRNPQDFALWFKRVGRFANHIQYWSSPWGDGFPGWHIECSAISSKRLGQPFDIHTGGVDHIGTHHTNEIAQSEAAEDGTQLAKFWMHGEFLNLENIKMAKSGENFITLSTLKEKGFHPLDFRFYILQAKYRTPLQFSWEALEAARTALQHVRSQIGELKNINEPIINQDSKWEAGAFEDDLSLFKEIIGNDLNTPAILGELQLLLKSKIPSRLKSIIDSKVLTPGIKLGLIEEFDKILGLKLIETPNIIDPKELPPEIIDLVERRNNSRIEKKWEEADRLRKEIERLGYLMSDTDDGPKIMRRPDR